MCGIGGILDFTRPARDHTDALRRLRERLRPRGPDGVGDWFGRHAALTHTRLALIDAPGGAQPMASADGRYVITYNGEVYNHPELREELSEWWHFRTRSDTEVVLAAYVRWGPACLPRLNGMFAFFVWDEQEQCGFGARDLLGVKPFVYRHADDQFAFASEAKALLHLLPGPPKPDVPALLEYLAVPCFSGVERPMFTELSHLLPGHALTVDRGGVAAWAWGDYHLHGPFNEEAVLAAEELRARLTAAVRRSLRADVPVGAFLSGGLDSTFLVALAGDPSPPGPPSPKRGGGEQTAGPRTFTVRFQDQDQFDYANSAIVLGDDTPFAEAAAQQLGVAVEVCPVQRSWLASDLRILAEWNDALPAWEQELAQHHLALAAATAGLKAVLVGDAADETHYGYHFLLDTAATSSPAGIIRRFAGLPIRQDVMGAPVHYFERHYRELIARAGHHWETPLRRTLATTYLIVKRWLPRLLHNGDVHTMAFGLEARVPFADTELLELARTIHPALAYRNGIEKWLLREAGRGIVPEAVRTRKKSALPKDQATQAVYQIEAARLLVEESRWLGTLLDLDRLWPWCDPRQILTEGQRAGLFRVICLAHWRRHYNVDLP